jgi:hypothetical protein
MADGFTPARWTEKPRGHFEKNVAPCGCASVLFHSLTCKLTHAELSELPQGTPERVRLRASKSDRQVAIGLVNVHGEATFEYLSPNETRALARELLFSAEWAERP